MTLAEKRRQRLMLLTVYYDAHEHDDELLLKRAKAMGVTETTAQDYLETIKKQIH